MIECEKIFAKDQKEYWLGVGMLLYQAKHLRPDIGMWPGNYQKPMIVQTLQLLKMLHVIKYVLDTKNFGLKLELIGNANEPWEIVCLSDSDYDRDLVSRRNMSGFILYVLLYKSLGDQKPKRVWHYQAQMLNG